jgi:hypothetical protein
MTEQCFEKKDSNPPICGVHNVLLTLGRTPIDSFAPYLGGVTCLICPVSQLVVLNSDGNKPRGSSGSAS